MTDAKPAIRITARAVNAKRFFRPCLTSPSVEFGMLAGVCATSIKGHPQFGHEGAETEQACPQSGQFLNLPWLLADRAVDSSLALGVNRTSQRAHVVTSFGEGAPQEGQNDSFIYVAPSRSSESTQRAGRFHLRSTER